MIKLLENLMGIWYEDSQQCNKSQEVVADEVKYSSFHNPPDTYSKSLTENWYNLWRELNGRRKI